MGGNRGSRLSASGRGVAIADWHSGLGGGTRVFSFSPSHLLSVSAFHDHVALFLFDIVDLSSFGVLF